MAEIEVKPRVGEVYILPNTEAIEITWVSDDHILYRNKGCVKEWMLKPERLADAVKLGKNIDSKTFIVQIKEPKQDPYELPEDTSYILD